MKNAANRSGLSGLSGFSGFAFLEVLVAAVILAVALVPASSAIRAASEHGRISRDRLAVEYLALAKLEAALAASWETLNNEAVITGGVTESTLWSDAVGSPNRRLVYVSPHDINNADGDNNLLTGVEAGILRVRVEVSGTNIQYQTLVAKS